MESEALNPEVTRMVIEAPAIAWKLKPGQFIILRIDEVGERIPLTVNDTDQSRGTITLVFQAVGATTKQLATMGPGDEIHDVVGPLGNPTDLAGVKHACVIGGGLGTAIAYPEAKALHEAGAKVDVIIGFRNEELILMKDAMDAISDKLIVVTDDGSNGNKGFVTDALQKEIDGGAKYDLVIAIGPIIMMKFVAKVTEPYGIKTIVSMNTIMIDGTGMCGGCRVRVGGAYKHACVDGPDFDGHEVDFDEAMHRNTQFKQFEQEAIEHQCTLKGEA